MLDDMARFPEETLAHVGTSGWSYPHWDGVLRGDLKPVGDEMILVRLDQA